MILLTPLQSVLRQECDEADVRTMTKTGKTVELHDELRVLAWRYGWETLCEACEDGMMIEERDQL